MLVKLWAGVFGNSTAPIEGVSFSTDEGETVVDPPAVVQGKSIWAKSTVSDSYPVKATLLGDSSVELEGTLNVVNAGFQNAMELNVDPLDEENEFAAYEKTMAVAHNADTGNIDLDASAFIEVTPSHLTWADVQDLFEMTAEDFFGESEVNSAVVDYDEEAPRDHEIYGFGIEIAHLDGEITDKSLLVIYSPVTKTEYDDWMEDNNNEDDSPDVDWVQNLPKVYSKLGEGNTDPEPDDSGLFGADDGNWHAPEPNNKNYHYNAAFTMRSHAIDGGFGHQATYDADGDLIEATINSDPETLAAAGTADLVSPNNALNAIGHANEDVWPFIRAAQLDGNPIQSNGAIPSNITNYIIIIGENLMDYFRRRPPHTGNQVEPGENSDPIP
jgi:hypothetical protein